MKQIVRRPHSIRRWLRRYRLRLQILALLLGILLGISVVDWLFEEILFQHPLLQQGPWKVTGRHFRSPEQSLWHWDNWGTFLDRVIQGKPGWLGQKWFYVVLLILYLWLTVVLFCRLTPPDDSPFPDEPDPSSTPPESAGSQEKKY